MAKDGRKAATQAAILEAALELFVKHGFRDTTVKAIADRANVSSATVMLHFRTKANLYAAVTDVVGQRFLEAVRHERTQSFRAVAHQWFDHLLDESKGYRLLCWLDDHRHPDIRATAESVRDQLVGVWRDWLDERAGAHWPPSKQSEVAMLVVAAIVGVTAVASHQRKEARAALERLVLLIEPDGASDASDDLPAAVE